jgi:hypothetical protein
MIERRDLLKKMLAAVPGMVALNATSLSEIPKDVKGLILTVNPNFGEDILIDFETLEKDLKKFFQDCGMENARILVLHGMDVKVIH